MSLSGAISSCRFREVIGWEKPTRRCVGLMSPSLLIYFFTSMLTLAIFFSHIIDVELEFIVSIIYTQHSRNYG